MKPKLPSLFTDPGYSHLSTSILSTSNCGNPALRLFGFGPVAADGYGIGYIIKEDGISMYVLSFMCDDFLIFLSYSCASSKHLQTRRFLDTLQGYLYEIQRILVQLHRAANARPAPFVDHLGILRDSKTGRRIIGIAYENGSEENLAEGTEEIPMREYILCLMMMACIFRVVYLTGPFWFNRFLIPNQHAYPPLFHVVGYSFFDSGEVELLGRRRKKSPYADVGEQVL